MSTLTINANSSLEARFSLYGELKSFSRSAAYSHSLPKTNAATGDRDYLLFRGPLAESHKNEKITSFSVRVPVSSVYGADAKSALILYAVEGDWSIDDALSELVFVQAASVKLSAISTEAEFTVTDPATIRAILDNGYALYLSRASGSYASITVRGLSYSSNIPSFDIVTSGTEKNGLAIVDVTPGAGSTIDPYNPVVVTVETTETTVSPCPVYPSAYQLRYRTSGATSYTTLSGTLPADGHLSEITIPADTFSAGTYEYAVGVKDSGSSSYTFSDWISVTTSDTTPYAPTILRPAGTIEDARKKIKFSWIHNNASGQPQKKAEIEVQPPGGMTTVKTVTGDATTYEFAENYFNAGTGKWRVRTYNQNNAAGPYSDYATFTVVSAPAAPAIVVTSATALPSFSWTVTEQEAAEISIDGAVVETRFGPSRTYTHDAYLDAGAHVVAVRVQNKYGMWSEQGSAAFRVDTAVGSIVLSVDCSTQDAELTWTTTDPFDFFIVYRDGAEIVRTTGSSYTDRECLGAHEWRVRGCRNTDALNIRSNTARGTLQAERNMVAPRDGSWLELRYSDSQHHTTGASRSRSVKYLRLAGRTYQEAELSEFYEERVSINCAIDNQDEKTALERMVGKTVIVKTTGGRCLVGVLDNLTITDGRFYTTYSFSVTRTE